MTTYEKLGEENLTIMVNTFYDLVLKEETLAPLFKTDINEIKRKQNLFLTQFLGGPSAYSNEFGHPRMRMRHMPHKITEAAAIAWLLSMKKAIEQLEISQELKQEVFSRFPQVAAHMVNS